MLFMPTNIIPSTSSGLGNGTIDVNNNLQVSWQVNGNSAMTSFSISIYKNDTSSTQLYSTGQISEGCPFYGTNYEGDVQFFSYVISSSALQSAGLVNGNEYKLIIRQWWNSTESVTQSSASVFLARTSPTVTISNILSPVSTKDYLFTATYTQEQEDAIMWFRWILEEGQESPTVLVDTGDIYGSADVAMKYDGLLPGDYQVRCIVETVNGIQADSGWVAFSVEYNAGSVSGFFEAKNYCGNVLLNWSGLHQMIGHSLGGATVEDNKLSLTSDAKASWYESNGEPFLVPIPYSVIWKGILAEGGGISIGTESGETVQFQIGQDKSISFISATGQVALKDGTEDAFVKGPGPWEMIVIITNEAVLAKVVNPEGGLYPAETLYPSPTLYPRSSVYATQVFQGNNGGLNLLDNMESISLDGPQTCEYLWVVQETIAEDLQQQILSDVEYAPSWGESTWMLADFTNGLNAGNLIAGDETPQGLSIYRRDTEENTLSRVVDLPLSVTQFVDFGVKNQREYVYYMFPIIGEGFTVNSMISSTVTPCSWNWMLILCNPDQGDGVEHMNKVFQFGKNFSSGDMSNNNAPELLENFTPYPLVQIKNANYESGTLSALIGTIDAYSNYSDTVQMRKEISALSTANGSLYLKSRKGDLWKIQIAGEIRTATMDNTPQQAQTMTIPWVEVESAERPRIISTPEDESWPVQEANGGGS